MGRSPSLVDSHWFSTAIELFGPRPRIPGYHTKIKIKKGMLGIHAPKDMFWCDNSCLKNSEEIAPNFLSHFEIIFEFLIIFRPLDIIFDFFFGDVASIFFFKFVRFSIFLHITRYGHEFESR